MKTRICSLGKSYEHHGEMHLVSQFVGTKNKIMTSHVAIQAPPANPPDRFVTQVAEMVKHV